MKNRGITIIVFLLFNMLLLCSPGIKIIKNSLDEIESKSGKITLDLVRKWVSNEDDDSYYFKTPTDIAVDSKNNIYIVDCALHYVNVFSSDGRYIRKIGQRGQGPGDLLTPEHIGIDEHDAVWIYETGNRRIQCFSGTGASLSISRIQFMISSNIIFPSPNTIALYDYKSAEKGEGIVRIIDRSGVLVNKIGMRMLPPRVDNPWFGGTYDYHGITFNRVNKTYFIAYKYSQMIQIFSTNGEMTACVFYDTPINTLKLVWEPKKMNYDLVDRKKYYSECVDLAIDDSGLLFIVISTRKTRDNEQESMVIIPGGTIMYRPVSKDYPEETDMYRLMVFGSDGKILAARQLTVFCDGIYIHKNHIFIIDRTFTQAIYEYRYSIPK